MHHVILIVLTANYMFFLELLFVVLYFTEVCSFLLKMATK